MAKGVFLESLEPYILSERIGCLTAPVMRDLLSYFQENGMMESVEGCLVHMDITNLDIQQVGLNSVQLTEYVSSASIYTSFYLFIYLRSNRHDCVISTCFSTTPTSETLNPGAEER